MSDIRQDCHATLWSALFSAHHSLDRYAAQGELFPEGEPEPDPTDPPASRPASPRPQRTQRPQRPAFHQPDAERAAENRREHVDLGKLNTGEKPGPMFPAIARDPAFHWIEQTSMIPSKGSAEALLRERSGKRGYHAGEIVPAGDFWRVNHLYRFPRVQYPKPNA